MSWYYPAGAAAGGSGTVTSVGLAVSPASVLSVSGSPVTTSGSVTLTVAQASASGNGYLASGDYTTFSNKQATIVAGTGITVASNTVSVDASHPLVLGGIMYCPSGRFIDIDYNSLPATGSVVLGTVPSGRRWAVNGYNVTNAGGPASGLVFLSTTISGSSYRITSNIAVVAFSSVSTQAWAPCIVLEAGDSLVVNPSGSGMNFYGNCIEYPDTVRFYSPKLLGLASGMNTVYTVPNGYTAQIIQANMLPGVGGTAGTTVTSSLAFCNTSTASRILNTYKVKPGGTAGLGNAILQNSSIGSGARFSTSIQGTIPTSGSIQVSGDGAAAAPTFMTWLVVAEFAN